ncbi:TolC family outer membrane protein [Roseovarius sp. S1116L3]|uniref:TolC family outer membrane protein n=1 Tax=Roseovarius roseus TaxID=3342636 RepID=UPI00372CCD3C
MMTLLDKARPNGRNRRGLIGGAVRGWLIGAALSLTAPAAMSETLADALAAAYNTSGLLEQNRALLRAADEDVAASVARLRPIISWTTDVTRTYNNTSSSSGLTALSSGGSTDSVALNAAITAEWLLYDFGRSQLTIASAKELVLATRQSLVGIEQDVLLRAVQAYMDVVRNTRFVALRRNNVRVIGESLRAAEDRFEVGEVTRTDVAQAEARLSLARSNLATAQGDLERAIEEYVAVTGRRPGNLVSPPRVPTLTRSEDTAKLVALRSHPDMLSAQYNVAAAELNVLVAEAAMRPSVSLGASLGVSENIDGGVDSDNNRLSLGLSGPIYQGGALSSAKRSAYAQRDAQLGVLHQTRDRIRQNVGIAYAILEAARASAISSGEQVRAGRVAFEGVNEEANLGARTTLDVLNAEQEYLDAQANQISAEADVIVAAYAVLESTGELTVRDLNLAVQTYDPAAYYNLVKDAPAALSERGKSLDRVLRKIGNQ